MKKALLVLVLLAGGITVYGYYAFRTVEYVPEITTTAVTTGDIVDTVGATGVLEAVTTVQVGSQVSGTIQSLSVDYNSIVRRGDVIMRLDPELFETQVEQARANLVRAEAETERLHVAVDDARTQLERARNLAARNLISTTELESAEVNLRSAEAQLKSAEAQVIQAEASLNQSQVNLNHTVIRAPIDGIVISRLVDVGQTVAASLQAPELFVIAADLTKMRVIANVDEADVGRIRPNQRVTFTVDAYPTETFEGSVTQVRLEPVVQQNVVTYATVIDAPNPELKLKPGMTATITLEIARREGVRRIPNAALRFRPTPEMFAILNQPVPEFLQQGSGRGSADVAAAPSRPDNGEGERADGVAGGAPGFGNGSPDPERMQQIRERLQQMSPDERERFIAERRAARGGGGRAGGDPPAARSTPVSVSADATVPTVDRGATTIDALFGPLPSSESTGRVWVIEDGKLAAANVRLGVTNGTATELLGPAGPALGADQPLESGTPLVTNISTPETGSPESNTGGGSPLIPQFPSRRR